MIQPNEAQIAQAREWISEVMLASTDPPWNEFLEDKFANDESVVSFIKQCGGFFDQPNLISRLRAAFEEWQSFTQPPAKKLVTEPPLNLDLDKFVVNVRAIISAIAKERSEGTIEKNKRTPLQVKVGLSNKDVDILDLHYGITRGHRLTVPAIAARRGRSPAGVESSLCRARNRIRAFYTIKYS